jgi:alkanesulfonate monooxygenase
MADLQFIGIGRASAAAELAPPTGPAVDGDALGALAHAHEAAGFDAVLVAASPTAPDALVVAGEILRTTDELAVLVTVAPPLIAPTAAARALATLAALYPGRVAAHLPPVISDVDARREGAPGDRTARQRQRAEFADVLVRTLTSDRPFDHRGEFFHLAGAWSAIRPATPLPLWMSGGSAAAVRLAAAHQGTYLTDAASAPAIPPGVRHALRLRPIVAATRAGAQDYAERVLRIYRGRAETPAAALREVTGALPGRAPLVGSADDVAATLREYAGLGVAAVQLAGWRPRADLEHYARVIAAVRRTTLPDRSIA